MKRIVLCTDGTWDGTSNNTNVYKLFNALSITAEQIPFYDDGVGVDGNPIEKFFGGAFGLGLYQKIKDGYTKISHVYEQDDEVFLFGFSRGAYTARSIAGMIAACGLPTGPFDDSLVNTAFDAYRNKDQREALLQKLSGSGMYKAPITMVGVWDTVGALGIPATVGLVDPVLYGFLDTSLNPLIKHGYHALAIDEKRLSFQPTLWQPPFAQDQTVEQVWFCGVHSDVGGGELVNPGDPSTVLSDITLSWMMSKAQGLGVQFLPAALAKYSFPLDSAYALARLHDSWSIEWGIPHPRTIPSSSSLSNSVLIRCQGHGGYKPGNLTIAGGVPASSYQLVSILKEALAEAAIAAAATATAVAPGTVSAIAATAAVEGATNVVQK